MKSLNKTQLLLSFLFIKIVCVACPTSEDLGRCESELMEEFTNDQPLDDFLHGFLHIKFHNVYWDENTNINEQIYIGNDILKYSTRGYYNELFNIALEMGLPDLSSPLDFCRTHHGLEEHDCLNAIQEIGCGADYTGSYCFERMYYGWNDHRLPGTENLFDEELLLAIHRGSEEFRYLSGQDLVEAFARRPDIIESLSDEKLLQDRYRQLYKHRTGRSGSSSESNDGDFYSRSEYIEFIKNYFNESDSLTETFVNDSNYRRMFDDQNVTKARYKMFAIASAPYAVVCEEYARRQNLPKFFDNLYAMDMCKKFKHSSWDSSHFIGRADFCEKYVSDE